MRHKRTSLQRFRLKKMLETLSSKEGRGTELVSLYVPPEKQISEVSQMLRDEWGTASNIKSNTTRKNVQDAIIKVIQRLKLYKKVPDNGLVLFCGAIPQNGIGSEKIEGPYTLIPPEPIGIYLYRCDSKFHTQYLTDLIKYTETYGILLLDSSGATFATLRGQRVEIVQEITSGIPGKHRAGGQSARRFERIREAQLNEFFKRIAQYTEKIFLSITELKGIILGGPGPTKYDFEKEGYLDYRLKDMIVTTIDSGYTGEQGVEEVFEKAPEIVKNVRYIEEKQAMQKFLYEIGHDTGLATYGEREVRRALNSGLISTLFLSEKLENVRIKIECSTCKEKKYQTMIQAKIIDIKNNIDNIQCWNCRVQTLQVTEEKDIIEEFAELAEQSSVDVEIISTHSEEGQMLWKSFGGIAAILRYKTSR